VTVARRIDGKEVVLAYRPVGHIVGEMALLRKAPRRATVSAAIATEAIRVDGALFEELLEARPDLRASIERSVLQKVAEEPGRERHQTWGGVTEFLVAQGVGEATDVLLIDESLCIRCDNCEKACAESHDGISRLDREAGPTFAMVHVPTSCRHCEHPHCMADCPPDAIHRGENGEVWIDGKIDRATGVIAGINAQQRVEVSNKAAPGNKHVIACLVANGPLGEPRGGIFMRYATLSFETAG